MRKAVFAFAMFLIMATCAFAQDGIFNHLAIGAGIGTDGISAEVAAPVGSHVQIRAGYGFASFDKGFKVAMVSVPEHPGSNYASSPHVDVPISVCPGINVGRLLVNVYPGSTSAFYFAAGAFVGSRNYINVMGSELPDDYNTVGYQIGNRVIRAKDNVARGQIRQGLVKPYAGIGFGRPVCDNRCSLTFDIGIQYLGNAELWAWGNSIDGSGNDDWTLVGREDIPDEFAHYYDEVKKWTKFWPTLSLRFWFKAF